MLASPSLISPLMGFNSEERIGTQCWKGSGQRHASHVEGPWNCPKAALSALEGKQRRGGSGNFSPSLGKRWQELQDDQSVSKVLPS